MRKIIITGGFGFIGVNFIEYLLNYKLCEKIYVIDMNKPLDKYSKIKIDKFIYEKKIIFINHDIRKPIMQNEELKNTDLIINLAAVHKMPGHNDFEYFETNIEGAKNICKFADKIRCKNIIFTSSISIYGSGSYAKDENTKPIPDTPYGKSKLEAEKIHEGWQKDTDKILLICRPGVVFGPGENGNVTRLVKLIKKKMFFYIGNKNVKKGGIYIYELLNQIIWINQNQLKKKFPNKIIFNGVFQNSYSFKDYAENIRSIYKYNLNVINIEKKIFLFILKFTSFITKNLSTSSNFNYMRLKKLIISNDIIPKFLIENNYSFRYDLKTSLQEWSQTKNNEW